MEVKNRPWFGIGRRTSRGHTLVALRHVVVNQDDVVVADFTERAIYMPASECG